MTWAEFKAACEALLTVDGSASRQAISGYNAIILRNGISDLQRFIPQLRNNQRNTWRVKDLVQEGETSIGTLPDKAFPREAFLIKKTCPCSIFPLVPYQWEYRFDLICDKPRRHEWPYYISVDPSATQFMVYPKLEEDDELWIYWDGFKADYADGDPVRFGDEEALAVSYYMKSHITLEVDKDLQLRREYNRLYRGGDGEMGMRTKLFLDWKERGEVRKPIRPPDPSCARCDPCSSLDCCWDYACATGGFSRGFWYLQHPTTGNWHKITMSEETGDLALKIHDPIADDCIEFDECLTASGKGYIFSGGYFHLLNETSGKFIALSITGAPGEEMIVFDPQKGTVGHISTTAFGFRLETCLELRNLDETCDRNTWHTITLVDIGAPQLQIGAGDCSVCPAVTVEEPEPPPTFLSDEQSVSCVGDEDLSANVSLPAYLTISGPSLILEAGYSSSLVDQATANAEALAFLQGYFDAGIASGDLVCGSFSSAQQTVSCPDADALVATGALPAGITISGISLVLAAGHSTSTVSQAAADASALAYLQGVFDDGLVSNLLNCVDFGTGLMAWWKADILLELGLVNDQRVDEWPDNTLNDNDLTANGLPGPDTRPTFKTNVFGTMPGVLFNSAAPGTFMLMDSNMALTDYTILAVIQQAAGNDGGLIGHSGLNRQVRINRGLVSPPKNSTYDGTTEAISGTTGTVTALKLASFTRGLTGVDYKVAFYDNTSAIGDVIVPSVVHDMNQVGKFQAGNVFDGYIAELLIFNVRKTAAEITGWYNDYFKPRWGLP